MLSRGGMHVREKVDRRLSRDIVVRRVIVPLCLDLGVRYVVKPYLGRYSDEDKTIKWGIGHKKPRRQAPPHQRAVHWHRLP